MIKDRTCIQKPVIGVIPLWDEEKDSIWMVPGYLDGIRDAGGIPVILPLQPEMEDLKQLDAMLDGYLFTGGHDVDPQMYGEEPVSACGVCCPQMSDGTLWEGQIALYFRWTCLPDCAVLELDADYRRNNRRLS